MTLLIEEIMIEVENIMRMIIKEEIIIIFVIVEIRILLVNIYQDLEVLQNNLLKMLFLNVQVQKRIDVLRK